MVSHRYLLEKQPRPGALKVAVDQQVIPFLINIAGDIEGVLERVARRTRAAPRASTLGALSLGILLAGLIPRRRS
jgi:hypothetical protein